MEKATKDGSKYIEASKGMYRLPHVGLLASELLKKRLNKYGYRQSNCWHPIQFTLTVDDFGVKYVDEEHVMHLN